MPPGPVWLAAEGLGETPLGVVAALGPAGLGTAEDEAATNGLATVFEPPAVPVPQAARARLRRITSGPSVPRRRWSLSNDRTFRRDSPIDQSPVAQLR